MMNDALLLLLSALGGASLGLMFFGGLLWTLHKGLASPAAGLWFAGSFVLRSGICVAGFYWIGAGDPLRILACLAGFIVTRVIITRMTGSSSFARGSESNEARDAP
jgi:F1F0 ATPase subunit 2